MAAGRRRKSSGGPRISMNLGGLGGLLGLGETVEADPTILAANEAALSEPATITEPQEVSVMTPTGDAESVMETRPTLNPSAQLQNPYPSAKWYQSNANRQMWDRAKASGQLELANKLKLAQVQNDFTTGNITLQQKLMMERELAHAEVQRKNAEEVAINQFGSARGIAPTEAGRKAIRDESELTSPYMARQASMADISRAEGRAMVPKEDYAGDLIDSLHKTGFDNLETGARANMLNWQSQAPHALRSGEVGLMDDGTQVMVYQEPFVTADNKINPRGGQLHVSRTLPGFRVVPNAAPGGTAQKVTGGGSGAPGGAASAPAPAPEEKTLYMPRLSETGILPSIINKASGLYENILNNPPLFGATKKGMEIGQDIKNYPSFMDYLKGTLWTGETPAQQMQSRRSQFVTPKLIPPERRLNTLTNAPTMDTGVTKVDQATTAPLLPYKRIMSTPYEETLEEYIQRMIGQSQTPQ